MPSYSVTVVVQPDPIPTIALQTLPPSATITLVALRGPAGAAGSSGGGDGGGESLTTTNLTVTAGLAAGLIVTPSEVPGAESDAAHLYSVTVISDPAHQGSVLLTDGQGGPVLALIPANCPSGDIHLASPKFFGTSVYATPNGQGPAYSIGVGP